MKEAQILEKLGMQNAPESSKQRILEQINAIIELRVAGLTEEVMTPEQKAEFARISEAEPREKVFEWLNSTVTNMNELYEAVLQDYLDKTA